MLARESTIVDFVTHLAMYFRGNDYIFALHARFLEELSSDTLALTRGIHIRGIEEIDPRFQGTLDEWPGFLFVQYPLAPLFGAITHHAQTQARDLHPRSTEIDVLHPASLSYVPFAVLG